MLRKRKATYYMYIYQSWNVALNVEQFTNCKFFHGFIHLYVLIPCMQALLNFISPVIHLAKYALDPAPSTKGQKDETYSEFTAEETRPILHAARFMNPNLFRRYDRSPAEAQSNTLMRSTSIDPVKWLMEFEKMELPMFWQQYLQVLHVPLDVMHECLKLQLELGKQQTFSPHIIKRVGITLGDHRSYTSVKRIGNISCKHYVHAFTPCYC